MSVIGIDTNPKRGRTITIKVKERPGLYWTLRDKCLASAGPNPSITGMRMKYWGMDALIVKYGNMIFYFGKDVGQELPF